MIDGKRASQFAIATITAAVLFWAVQRFLDKHLAPRIGLDDK
jgi:hypothetical protein